VSGPPGSGKSTLAVPLASALGLPLLAKDVIKDALMSVQPPADIEASRQAGRAAVAVMLAVAVASPVGAVIESNFHRSRAVHDLRGLPGDVVEVFCRCDRAVVEARYRSRAGSRHPGHFDDERSADDLWNPEVCAPVAGGWLVLEVDTNAPVDVEALVRRIQAV
jgi:predicted kinase